MRTPAWIAVAGMAVAIEAFAQCAGFDDVDPAHAFCPDLQWMRNRAITRGCTSPTLYCPGGDVSRLAMAGFMNRLGVALTPTVVRREQQTAGVDLDGFRNNPNANYCQTAPFTVTGFPRQVVVNGHWTGLPAGLAQVFTILTVSTDFGSNFSDLASYGMRDTGNGTWIQTGQTYGMNLAVGQSYVFAIGIERAIDDPGSVDLSQSRCNVVATIHNRNSASAPLDEDPPRGPPDNR